MSAAFGGFCVLALAEVYSPKQIEGLCHHGKRAGNYQPYIVRHLLSNIFYLDGSYLDKSYLDGFYMEYNCDNIVYLPSDEEV